MAINASCPYNYDMSKNIDIFKDKLMKNVF